MPIKGTWADKLNNMCLYDILIMMDGNLTDFISTHMESVDEEYPCIITLLTKNKNHYCEKLGDKNCEECVRLFLLEPAE